MSKKINPDDLFGIGKQMNKLKLKSNQEILNNGKIRVDLSVKTTQIKLNKITDNNKQINKLITTLKGQITKIFNKMKKEIN